MGHHLTTSPCVGEGVCEMGMKKRERDSFCLDFSRERKRAPNEREKPVKTRREKEMRKFS